ncbi:hypothetical protein C2I19_18725 [Chromobacterium alticapitis]|uniref:Uncharacterized protein n=1 Tax=Chromobacterium alticapitis TaxID=2073169 RepID=A0A2S5DBV7_9NEIS|nr:hypothetical protein C2I19_18725 [Chromobacterium alticapitis]
MNESTVAMINWPRGLFFLGLFLLQLGLLTDRIHSEQDRWLVSHTAMITINLMFAIHYIVPRRWQK